MGRRKSLIQELLDARAKARKVRERQNKAAQAAAFQAQREHQRQVAAADRKRAGDEARVERERQRAAAAQARAAQTAIASTARAAKVHAAERAKAVSAAARAEKLRAVEEKINEAARRTTSLQVESTALNRVLQDRARPLPSVAAKAESRFNVEGIPALLDVILDELQSSVYPLDSATVVAAEYRFETRELIVELELPRNTVGSTAGAYRYVKARDAIEAVPRRDADIKTSYGQLVARVVLRALAEAFDASPPLIVTRVSINGYVSTMDRSTGRAIRPCLISVGATRDEVEDLDLDEPDLDPQACLRHLNAMVSPHPYELEAVRPLVTFDLSGYKFVDEMNVVAGLDSRIDLLDLTPTHFEHLVRELFEAMGMKSWVTQSSRDEGVDAVVTNEDPIVGGLCIIQAKRYSRIVGLEAVNALAGVMNDKAAAKGVLVTTSWVGQAS